MAMVKSTVHCPMARHGLSINQDGTLDPCCQYTKQGSTRNIMYWDYQSFCSQVRDVMQRDFEQGGRHPGCQKCYQEEDLGLTSLRQHFNKWYSNDKDIATNAVYDIELRLGNLCNLKCIMCFPDASSAVATERYQHREEFRKIELALDQPWKITRWWEDSRFVEFASKLFGQCRRINITGGEPFIIPEVVPILQQLPATVTVSFNTNLTRLPEEILQTLTRFENLIINVSLEGTAAMNDYLRYPSSWQDIVDNLQQLRKRVPQAHYGVNHTFQHASVYSLLALAEMCTNQDLVLQMTMVTGMPWLTLDSVPTADVKRLQHWAEQTAHLSDWRQHFVVNACEAARFNLDLYHKYRQHVSALDAIRGTNYDCVFCPSLP